MTLVELMKTHGLSFTGSITISGQYYISLDQVEIMNDGMLEGATEYGKTLDEAAGNLCERICSKRLVKNAFKGNRYEFDVPETLRYIEWI